MTERNKGGRPRGPSTTRLASGKRGARVTVDIDGEKMRRRVQFDTSDAKVAEKKAREFRAEALPAPGEVSKVTFREQAEAECDAREARKVSRVDIERGRLSNHAYPFVGELVAVPFGERPIAAITADEVKELLESQRARGYSRTHIKHLRNSLKYTFESAKLAVMEDKAAAMPLMKAELQKQRAVASDEVLLAYLAWQHPIERFRVAVLMRQTMSCVSRCLGGERTNDLHVATWEGEFGVTEDAEPDFATAWIPRTKGQAPQEMLVPEGLSPVIHRWWVHQGKPRSGPVFPLLRGEHVGGARETQDSHAAALRTDLRRALGLMVWSPTGGRRKSGAWVPGRPATAAERKLFEEGKYTLPVDFHSWRRAWSRALMKAGVNVQTAAAMTGHAGDLKAHGRYVTTLDEKLSVPAGAVPALLIAPQEFGSPTRSGSENTAKVGFGQLSAKTPDCQDSKEGDSSMISRRARKDSNLRPLASEAETEAVFKLFPQSTLDSEHPEIHSDSVPDTARGQYSRPEPTTLEGALELAVRLAMGEGDLDSAGALLEVAKRRRATPPDNIAQLDPSRRRKS